MQIMARPGCLPAMPACDCRNSMSKGMAGTLQMGVSMAGPLLAVCGSMQALASKSYKATLPFSGSTHVQRKRRAPCT